MAGTAADRNLLLGIIALQMDFITRDALIAAMSAWVLKKETTLSQILEEHGALSATRHGLLDALVAEHIRVHGGDAQKSLAALSSIGSVHNDLNHIVDTEVRASLPLVAAARGDQDTDPYQTVPRTSVGESSSIGTRFRVLRPHARGGLGQVSVALDQELDRRVALKEIQERHADDLTSRARFVQEAEITGKLEHPGIIPVYGLGHDAAGRPFYAMRFIEGDSLGEAITAFHRDPAAQDRDAHNTRLRELLRRFTDVCNAIAYAHSRGVLHRDLKPGNIMLGPYGETLVVDWGLAKAAGEKLPGSPMEEPSSTHNPSMSEAPIRLSGLSGSRDDTISGAPIGTPAFASPEQVTGAMDRLGPATDIYGLGATLYCLLTGRAPVDVGDLLEVITRVGKGDIPTPRSVDPTIARPLEAICRKAMALEPADRYPSAWALAEDVTHWLDDAPVSAYQEPASVRAGRWIRRHQRLVSSAVAAVLVGLIAMWIAYSRETGINHNLRVAIVKNQIGSSLEHFGGNDSEIDFVAGQIKDLARLAPEEAAQERRTLGEHLVVVIAKMVHQERSLATSDIQRIRHAIARTSEYAPNSVAELEAALQERIGKLNQVLVVASPFDGLRDGFEVGSVRIDGPGLIAGGNAPAGGDPIIPSKVACDGDVEIDGTFALSPGAPAGIQFGLALNVAAARGYTFTLAESGDHGAGTNRPGPGSRQTQPERMTMTIRRNKVVLRETEVELPVGAIRLFAQKKGDKITFTIGKTELGFVDIFPLSAANPGVFGVVLSAGVRLDTLEARKQALPRSPSRLENGDTLFSQGKIDKALLEFDRVESTTEAAEVKSEAAYKTGICLVELKRTDEAKQIFEKLAVDTGPWQTRAICQVWKILLKSANPGDQERADLSFDTLHADFDYAELALVLSEEERDQILAYYRQVDHYPRINWTRQRVRNLQRALDIERLIKANRVTRQRTLWRLADCYRLDGRERDAVAAVEKLLASPDLLADDRIGITRDYASMMIMAGTPAKALAEIDKQLGPAPPGPVDPNFPMILHRARIHAAMQNWEKAEADVARFIEMAQKPSISYNDFADACLFRGFLLERRGDKGEAVKASRAGLRKNWPSDLPVISTATRLDGKALRDNFGSLLHFEMLASLTRELARDETDSIVGETMGRGEFTQSPIVKFFDLFKNNNELLAPEHIQAIMVEMYNSRVGHEFARQEAYLAAPLGARFDQPLLLAVAAEIRLSAIPDGDSPELAGLIDEGLQQISRSVQESKFSLRQLMLMMSSWLGRADYLGWLALESSLKSQPDLRGRIAYVYGRRFLVLKQPAVARHLFELTKSDLPHESPFQKLAKQQLDKLGAK